MQNSAPPPAYTPYAPAPSSSRNAPLSAAPTRRSSSSASSANLCMPEDYNPLQYPPPSRVRAGATKEMNDMSDLEPEDGDYSNDIQSNQIGGFPSGPSSPRPQNIQGANTQPQSNGSASAGSGAKPTYQLRSPIQPKEFFKGVVLALEGCWIALTNPDFRNGRLYKVLLRLLVFTLISHLVTQIVFFLPVVVISSFLRLLGFVFNSDTTQTVAGLEIFSNKVHEIMSSIPLIGLLFLRYLYPQPLDDIFIDALVYSDHLLVQEHEHIKLQQQRQTQAKQQGGYLSVDTPTIPSKLVMDHRGLFAPALLAYPYKVRHWDEMKRYMRRTWRRLKWGLLILVLSWIPFLGQAAFPAASFLSTLQSIGSKPLAALFAMTSFFLPRRISIYLLKGFFGCRTLTRELLDPYFIRLGMTHYQKRKWFNYRKSVLLGFGVVFYIGCSIPVIGVAVFGLAQASSAFVLQSLADPPPSPVVKPKDTSKSSRKKQE
ncbi:hypothetical protein BGW38_005071 [Lunasporangiospora selenospora]|uniref:Transmembrane protein n=1 Tax=Lunasporangiospora selenospora TaxID=979761 RepID=A0A9P6G0H3_9FUNG|nr:hypothetical protein BGW38_005071 [Lunasporangiospora selenospora]